MPTTRQTLYLLCHPEELRAVLQWKVWHEPVHRRDASKETPTEKACFQHLVLTSRSFAAVIQELTPELLMSVCLFYLVLRGLDTIEDDMTIPLEKKVPLLRGFDDLMEQDGWTFTENGPNEKDRELLVHFDDVVTELKRLNPAYYAIIRDITTKMGNGMADYALNAEQSVNGIATIAEYELYCHYVAGLVGEGLTRLFVESKLANPQLMNRPQLTESMGQFLQKTNIIRDIHEDFEDGRRFWPKDIWSKYVDRFDDLFDPAHLQQALYCQSEMVLNALKHAEDCLFYMAAIREQSVFNFVAIPQTMAIATLELVFQNPDVFKRNVKITKGTACRLMLDSTQNLQVACEVFRRYARRIHQRNDPRDPNFASISLQCGKIEQFIESLYPTQDVKQIVPKPGPMEEQMRASDALLLVACTFGMLLVVGGVMIGSAWILGTNFDKISNMLGIANPSNAATLVHEEL
ncbi:squalene synthetase [Grosmannia clavigera kw1407]|uniref:Squalene synthase n=1 Tax=Grosmannia clavigera (strain kw1407 / UAMH 11150) TaxID=655863 RepID=F0XIS3_GROCL|nr:squalene synthetase [Grosmannia clavigera kw1407]EFX02204.1 squalene synthetase [Grosmannia clavigera kw1407]